MTDHELDPMDEYGRRIGRELHALSTRAIRTFDAAAVARQVAVADTHRGATALWDRGALGGRRRLILILLALATGLVLALSVTLGPGSHPVSVTNGRIAYAIPGLSTYASHDIWTVDPDGPGLPQVFHSEPPLVDSAGDGVVAPTWSPDGRHIAYLSLPGQGFALMVADADGSAPRVLFRAEGDPSFGDDRIAWSPDGTMIAAEDGKGRPGEFVVLDVATGAVVLRHPGTWPTWSPEGSRLAFVLATYVPNKSGQSVHTSSEIQVMDLSGGSATTLASWDGSSGVPAELEWSPDGGRIAYDQDSGGGRLGDDPTAPRQPIARGVFVIDVADGRPRDITGDAPADTQQGPSPHWSPDGTRLLYRTVPVRTILANPDNQGRGIAISDATGTTVTVLDIPNYGAQWSPDGMSILSSQGNGTRATSIGFSDASGLGPRAVVVDLTGIEDTSTVEMSWQPTVP